MPFSSTLGNILQGVLATKGTEAAKKALNSVTSKVNSKTNQIAEEPKVHTLPQTTFVEPEEEHEIAQQDKKEEQTSEDQQTENPQDYLSILDPTAPALTPRIQEVTTRAAEAQQKKPQDDFWSRFANAAAYDAQLQPNGTPYGTFGTLAVSSNDMMNRLYDEAQNGGNQAYEAYYGEPLQEIGQTDDAMAEFARNTVDDGTNNIQSRTSQWITGEEVQRQIAAGVTPFNGDISQIDPMTVYNKFDLAQKYDYRPYMPDESVRKNIVMSKEMSLPNEAWNAIARSRENVIHGTADINGKQIDTTDLEQRKTAWSDNMQREYENIVNQIDNGQIFSTPEEAGNYALPVGRTNPFYRITVEDGAGNVIDSQDIASDAQPEINWNDDGSLNFYFPDIDQSFDFDVPEDGDVFYDPLASWSPVSPDQAEGWVSGITGMTYDDMQGLKMADGQTVSLDELMAYENGEFNRDYGPLNLGKPATQISHEEFNAEDFAPWFMDMFNSSARYFNPVTSWMAMPSDVYMAANNLDPQSRMAGGTSQLKSDDDVNDLDYGLSIAANAAMPLTEYFAGGIGGASLLGSLAKPLLNKLGTGTVARRAADAAGDIIGEGIEEITPGQFMEELASNGWSNAFANELTDEEGNPIFDDTGHIKRDANTSLQDRLTNFAGQIPESFMGGLLLGGTMGGPAAVSDFMGNVRNDRLLKELFGKDYVEHPEWFEPTKKSKRQANNEFIQRPQEIADIYDRER